MIDRQDLRSCSRSQTCGPDQFLRIGGVTRLAGRDVAQRMAGRRTRGGTRPGCRSTPAGSRAGSARSSRREDRRGSPAATRCSSPASGPGFASAIIRGTGESRDNARPGREERPRSTCRHSRALAATDRPHAAAAPQEMPHSIPSSRASRRVISNALVIADRDHLVDDRRC